LRVIFLVVFIINLSFASLISSGYDTKDLEVLRSLDIDDSFLKERAFLSMKESFFKDNKRELFLKKLNDAYIFVPIIKDMIKEAKIPEAFLYLAMAESNFSIKAYSKKRASGLWQFMPRTAKGFGLKINSYVDERRDPIKSTKIAIKYLKYLHKMFDKWYLAAIAYNCGEGRLRKAIRLAKSTDLKVLLDSKKKYLPKESRLYIRKILSLAIMSNKTNFLLLDNLEHLLNRGSIYPISTVTLKGGVHLSDVASSMNISLREIRKLNKHLKNDFLPPYEKRYDIYIPYNRLALFKANFKERNVKFLTHIVKKGDSLYKIGKNYRVNYRLIKDMNKLKSNNLKLGRTLLIPIPKRVTKSRKKPVLDKNIYTIQSGDTLDRISKVFKISIKDLKRVNNLTSNIIKVGDKIVIPN